MQAGRRAVSEPLYGYEQFAPARGRLGEGVLDSRARDVEHVERYRVPKSFEGEGRSAGDGGVASAIARDIHADLQRAAGALSGEIERARAYAGARGDLRATLQDL